MWEERVARALCSVSSGLRPPPLPTQSAQATRLGRRFLLRQGRRVARTLRRNSQPWVRCVRRSEVKEEPEGRGT